MVFFFLTNLGVVSDGLVVVLIVFGVFEDVLVGPSALPALQDSRGNHGKCADI
jgi:hypothetical protein